jgi:AcrR family transcriptional regulator
MSRTADPRAKSMLLRAAEEVFAEKGLAGAKVEEIARRSGVSKGAFYLHFESKEAALKQLVESFLARCQSFFAPPSAYPDFPDDSSDLLDFTLERDVQIYEFLWQNRAFLRILPTCQGEYDYLVLAFRAEVDGITREWVDHWRREGIFRPEVDPELAAALIGGAYHELSMRMLLEEKRPPLEEWLRFALETFFRAFGSPEMVAAIESRNRRVTTGIEAPVARSSANGTRGAARGMKDRRHI